MSKTKELHILHLYPQEMNMYGDWGNVLTLLRRAEWHGYTPVLHTHNPGKALHIKADIIVGGGGQDSGQDVVKNDLLRIGDMLHSLAEKDVPMLMVCGLYQLFGRSFTTQDGNVLSGIGIFQAETHAGPKRLIGNVVVETTRFGELIGYENHSGLTSLDSVDSALGTVPQGAGNNGTDGTEGAVYKNVIGTYLHGSLLPKNPELADTLLEIAATNRYGSFEPGIIDDRFAKLARDHAKRRPR